MGDTWDRFYNVKLCEEIAREAHKGQKRRGGDDYINHPLRVAEMVEPASLKCLAILHDVIEDTEETASSLMEKGISEFLVEMVELMTKCDGQSYEEYIRVILNYPGVARVKLADMIDNLSGDPTQKQKDKYRSLAGDLLKAF